MNDSFEKKVRAAAVIPGGLAEAFYKEKYGREITGPEYPATLDHIIAGVAG
jgi:hypothetical protein